MMDFKDTIIKLNDILKKNDLLLVDEFVSEYGKLVSSFGVAQFFIDMNSNLVNHCYRLIIMLYKEKATFSHLVFLMNNYNNKGNKMVEELRKLSENNSELKEEIEEIVYWFLNDYYTGATGMRGSTKTYEHCYIARFLSNFIAHKSLSYN